MKIALVTDAWQPQVNGVVTTLVELVEVLRSDGHTVEVLHPAQFRTRPCPGYAGIDLAIRPGPALAARLSAFEPDAIHLATEGSLGWAGRRYCLRNGLHFTTAFHTRFPELLKAALRIPLWAGYALFRRFHAPSSGVMVPTRGVERLLGTRGFNNLRAWTHGVDTAGFPFQPTPRAEPLLGPLPRPVSLFVGRLSYEKNVEAFLKLDLPGTKVVCGVGPLETELQARYPSVRWLGILPRDVLAGVYGAADVFVFPCRHETFGLVMLEAMACGTPVAAFPVDGPLEVVQTPAGAVLGGILAEDLRHATLAALQVPRAQALARAREFGWPAAAASFLHHLVPANPHQGVRHETVAPLSHWS